MTKGIIEKISTPRTPLRVDDMSAEEKKEMMRHFSDLGFTESTFYLRFFQKGFYEWEIIGIKECKKQFLALPDVARSLLGYEDSDTQRNGDGYSYILAMSDRPGQLLDCLRKTRGLLSRFCEFMEQKGMCKKTTFKRFDEENWRDWELQGIRNILTGIYEVE